jgi:hypothetical protein
MTFKNTGGTRLLRFNDTIRLFVRMDASGSLPQKRPSTSQNWNIFGQRKSFFEGSIFLEWQLPINEIFLTIWKVRDIRRWDIPIEQPRIIVGSSLVPALSLDFWVRFEVSCHMDFSVGRLQIFSQIIFWVFRFSVYFGLFNMVFSAMKTYTLLFERVEQI